VLGFERLAAVVVGDPGLAVGDVLERQVRGVAAIAEGEQVAGIMLDQAEQRVQ
jgi:hypothetical protein